MARPKKSPSELRTNPVNIGLTAPEKDFLQKQADASQKTITDFMRSAALNKPIAVIQSPVPDRDLKNEIRRIGVNIHQLVRDLNMNKIRSLPPETASLLTSLDKKIDDLYYAWISYDTASGQKRPKL